MTIPALWMADYLLFQKAQRKSFTMNSVNDERWQGKLALSESMLMLLVQETQSVFHPHARWNASVAMRINKPDSSTFAVERWDSVQAPAYFVEIVSDYFPILHAADSDFFALHKAMTSDMNGPNETCANVDRCSSCPFD
jgi:hypothetical protein